MLLFFYFSPFDRTQHYIRRSFRLAKSGRLFFYFWFVYSLRFPEHSRAIASELSRKCAQLEVILYRTVTVATLTRQRTASTYTLDFVARPIQRFPVPFDPSRKSTEVKKIAT